MIFIETQIFAKRFAAYLSDQDYRELQNFLLEKPDIGDVIQGTGGLRKVRWGTNARGKRGGLRIIYYWQKMKEQIYLLTLYAKNEMTDLSMKEKKILKQMVEEW